jgi:hypothetical protein
MLQLTAKRSSSSGAHLGGSHSGDGNLMRKIENRPVPCLQPFINQWIPSEDFFVLSIGFSFSNDLIDVSSSAEKSGVDFFQQNISHQLLDVFEALCGYSPFFKIHSFGFLNQIISESDIALNLVFHLFA